MKCPKNIIQITLIVSVWVLAGGCRQVPQPKQETPVRPDMISADCIVNYFQTDNAPYITQQQHFFDPSSGHLEIIADEPSGRYKFTLNNGNFSESGELTPFLSGLPASFFNQPLATAVFYSFTAGAGLLDVSSLTALEPAKIEGQWYLPLQLSQTEGDPHVTLLKSRETNRIERVQFQDSATETQWMLKSYNFRYSKELDTLVPMKIDVFDITGGIASKKLIVQFDYKRITKSQIEVPSAEKNAGNITR